MLLGIGCSSSSCCICSVLFALWSLCLCSYCVRRLECNIELLSLQCIATPNRSWLPFESWHAKVNRYLPLPETCSFSHFQVVQSRLRGQQTWVVSAPIAQRGNESRMLCKLGYRYYNPLAGNPGQPDFKEGELEGEIAVEPQPD